MRLPKNTKEAMIDVFLVLSLALTLFRILKEEFRLLL